MQLPLNEKPNVLAIIPARGGSKGIPRKNIMDLCGKPLIAYSIEAAVNAKLVDRVVISTEDEEIAEIAKSFGAEVPFLRPNEMAQDKSKLDDAINYTVNHLQKGGYKPDFLVTLFPTHPFRTPYLIDCLVKKMLDGYSPVNTAKLVKHNSLSVFSRNKKNQIIPLLNSESNTKSLKSFYRNYGLFLGIAPGFFDKPYLHVLDDPISLIDIDTLSDFFLAEMVINHGLFDFNAGKVNGSNSSYL